MTHFLVFFSFASHPIASLFWGQVNPYYQFFCGNEYFEHSLPIDSSSMTRFRKRMGSETIDELFKETVASAERSNQLKEKDFEYLNVDTTVQEKAISFPTEFL